MSIFDKLFNRKPARESSTDLDEDDWDDESGELSDEELRQNEELEEDDDWDEEESYISEHDIGGFPVKIRLWEHIDLTSDSFIKENQLYVTLFGDTGTTKKVLEDGIEHFSKEQNVRLSSISDFFKGEMRKAYEVKENLDQFNRDLNYTTDALFGKSQKLFNNELHSAIKETSYINKGITGENGYGLLHIIENSVKEGRNDDEITAVLYLAAKAASEGKIIKTMADKVDSEKARHIEIEKDGITVLVSPHKYKNGEKWLLTGFGDKNNKEKTAEAVRTVIAQYGGTPKFSECKNKVGAVASSLLKPDYLETAQKTGYVQGVCESVLAFNNDENRKLMSESNMAFLSKKLLSEMNVTKDMAQKFANPETYKALEQCLFAPEREQNREQMQSLERKGQTW
jgi:hypothetical protein